MKVKHLKRLLDVYDDDELDIRVGSDDVQRFDYLDSVGCDNDTGTLILYFDSENHWKDEP